MLAKAVIFDWDGTLADTIPLTFKIYKEVFRKLKKRGLSFEDFKKLFSREHERLYSFMKLTPKEKSKADRAWKEVYGKRQKEIKLCKGARELLTALKDSGIKTALVSSGKKLRVEQELKQTNSRKFFNAVVTAEEIPEPKPHPIGLLYAIKLLNEKPENCVYAGDMAEDIEAGKKAGMKTIAVLHGMHSREALETCRPDFFAWNLKELKNLLCNQPSATP